MLQTVKTKKYFNICDHNITYIIIYEASKQITSNMSIEYATTPAALL